MSDNVATSIDKLAAADMTVKKLDDETGMVVSLVETNGVTHIFPFSTEGMKASDVDKMVTRMKRARKRVSA